MSWRIKLGSWFLEGGRTPSGSAPARDSLVRLESLRPSLRTNVVLMVLAMLVLPQLIVVGWSLMERDIGGKLEGETKTSVEEASVALERVSGAGSKTPASSTSIEDALDEVAARWGTRIRLIGDSGKVQIDVDADRGTDLVHQIGTLFFGPDGAPTLREFDETVGPLVQRPETLKVTRWNDGSPRSPTLPEGTHHYHPPAVDDVGAIETGCRTSPNGKLLVCHATRAISFEGRPHVLYAQESSRRAVRALYDLRYHLARLSFVMLPIALLFSWWMGRRMVRPIERLRGHILEKARSANPRADIDLHGGDEMRELAGAFNDLLAALDERRQANEAFVADLVHEFKNPVAAIRACAESLGTGGADEKRAARIAKILSDSSGRLDALVSQFLELARAEAGMPREQRSDVDLGALARGVAGHMEPSFADVRFEVDAPADAVVFGVAPRLDSVVRNLVDNAASFAGPGGLVRIGVRREARDGSAVVVLEVGDSGPGIAAEDLPHVFDRFFTTRALAPTKPARALRDGSGLGLALVKAIAEAHGGDVSVRSTPGEGATFRVTLPARV